MTTPTVYLVGAGPGDPALLTVRAAQLLARADVILHDALVDERILALAYPDALLIPVGKRAGGSRTEQSEINRLLLSHARSGKTVLRLKGGDPFLFGRGGEEALALAEANIPFEIVPGLTAAVAAGACSAIPLTHRGLSSACIFVTGHEDPAKPQSDINWPALASSRATLCIYMGLANLPALTRTLIDAGRPPDEPAALIASASLPEQRTLVATLSTIAADVERSSLRPPALLIVGPVVSLRDSLAWFESRPLFGKQVLVTRPADQSASLVDRLTLLGARPLLFPTIETRPVEDTGPLDRVIARLSSFDWVVFSSANAVRFFFDRLRSLDLDSRAFASSRIAVIGPATARVLRDLNLIPDLVPPQYLAESLLSSLLALEPVAGKSILLPRSDIGRDVLAEGLASAGALVTDVVLYRTIPASHSAHDISRLRDNPPHVLTFTSASTVSDFVAILGPAALDLARNAVVVSIGPVTSDALRRANLPVHVEAPVHTAEGLVDALLAHLGTDPD